MCNTPRIVQFLYRNYRSFLKMKLEIFPRGRPIIICLRPMWARLMQPPTSAFTTSHDPWANLVPHRRRSRRRRRRERRRRQTTHRPSQRRYFLQQRRTARPASFPMPWTRINSNRSSSRSISQITVSKTACCRSSGRFTHLQSNSK